MELQARKYDLIQALVHLKDLSLLQKLETVINSHQAASGDWWNEISDEEKAGIEEGIAQLERGEGIPHEEVRKMINAKLGR